MYVQSIFITFLTYFKIFQDIVSFFEKCSRNLLYFNICNPCFNHSFCILTMFSVFSLAYAAYVA